MITIIFYLTYEKYEQLCYAQSYNDKIIALRKKYLSSYIMCMRLRWFKNYKK